MKRIALVAALLLGGVTAAQADSDVYNNTWKVERGDFELHADTAACDQQYGAPQNGTVTSRAYRRCMLTRGWRFAHTVREKREATWTDPETGPTCRDLKMGGAVIGSSCSNF
jgi:hypothetical protein